MYRILAKLVVLGVYVAFAVNFYISDGWITAGLAGAVTFGIGCLSFKPKVSTGNDRTALRVLLQFSFILLAFPICLFRLLPYDLYVAGVIHDIPHQWSVSTLLFASAIMVFYIWIPFVCFWVLDTAFDWVRKERGT